MASGCLQSVYTANSQLGPWLSQTLFSQHEGDLSDLPPQCLGRLGAGGSPPVVVPSLSGTLSRAKPCAGRHLFIIAAGGLMLAGRQLAWDSLLLKPLERHEAAQGTWYLSDIESPKLLNSYMNIQSTCLTRLYVLVC